MSSIIKITNHPTDPDVILAHIGPELATQAGMLRSARYSPEDRAYLLHPDSLPGLEAFARHVGAHLLNKLHKPVTHNTVPHECRTCGQPGRANHPPTYCPNCGTPWDPIAPPGATNQPTHTRCNCGNTQNGRFTHCTRCGQPMTYPKATPPPDHGTRTHLDDPLPLRATIEETHAALTDTRGHRP